MTEGEIIFDGIVWVVLSKRRRDLLGCRPRSSSALGEAEVSADAINVGVDGDHEHRRRNRPKTEVDAIGSTHHPARIEQEPLAGAAGTGIAHQMLHVATGRLPAESIGEQREGFSKVFVAGLMERRKGVSERPVFADECSCVREHRRDVLGAIDPVDESTEPTAQGRRPRARHLSARAWAESGEHPLDARARSDGIAKRKARGHETCYLPIDGIGISMNEVDRISASPRLGVAVTKKRFESRASRIHLPGSCYIAARTAMNRAIPTKSGIHAICVALVLALGCAGPSAQTPAGSNAAEANPPRSRLELGIRLSDGRWLELGDLQGVPVLVYAFATFDMVSQAALKPLRLFVQQHPEVVVIGVASEPRATQLVEAWAYALDPPFVVGADPYGNVENGQSALGRIETVPTYILYDTRGFEIERTTGYQGLLELDEMLAKIP